MPDFSHLRALEQKLQPRQYRFDQIDGAPSVWFLPGTDANKVFMNESLRRANARAPTRSRSRRVTTDTVAAARQEDREVIAFTCAQSWDVRDAQGKTVEFSPQNCLEFFEALPDWIFDECRAFVVDPGNFVDAVAGTGGEELGEA